MLREVLLPCGECGEDLGLAIVCEVVACVADAKLSWCVSEGNVVDGVCECRAVAEIAKEQTESVEGGCEMEGAGPALFAVTDTDRSAVAGEPAECGGDANRTSGVGADGCDRGAFLHACRCAAGGAAGEQGCVAWLDTVAILGVFAGDAVGELVEMGFSDDDRTRVEQALRDPRVFLSIGIELCVVARAAAGCGACYVKAIFDRDRNAIEQRTISRVSERFRKLFGAMESF